MAGSPTDTTARPPAGAVFLSYARENTDAAKRIAEALRGRGIEVWFDQAELHGGDAWDAKIRTQIKTCALFVPLVSAQTEERTEGYFRREWKLAVDRTHDMAGNRSFIVPVVIDATKESQANVPEEFLRFQWTRLADGAASPQFVEQVRRLLDGPKKSAPPMPRPGPAVPTAAEPVPNRPRLPLALGLAATLAIATVAYLALRPAASGPATASGTSAKPIVPAPSPAAADQSVAVLPFINLSGDKEQEYFSDGLTEEILNALARERDLRVPGSASSFSFKGKSTPLPEIARALHVTRLVEGSVRKQGTRVRISVKLTRAADGFSEELGTFTEELSDIFALQDKVARTVVEKLTRRGGAAGSTNARAVPTKNAAAYDAYLRGRAAHLNRSEAQNAAALGLYEQAVRLDPDFALAWARLAEFCVLNFRDGFDRSDEMAAKARAAAAAALRLDPDQPEAHLAQATISQYVDRDLDAARRELDFVERVRPNETQVPAARARLAFARGPWNDVLAALVTRAVEADPQNPSVIEDMVRILMSMGRFADADRLIDQGAAAGWVVEAVTRVRLWNLDAWTGDTAAGLALLAAMPGGEGSFDHRLYSLRATLRARSGDFAGATADFEQCRAYVAAHYPNRSGPRRTANHALYHLARLAERQGQAARARELDEQAFAEAGKLTRADADLIEDPSTVMLVLARRGRAEECLTFVNNAQRLAALTHDLSTILLNHSYKAEALALLGRTDDALAELHVMAEAGYGFGYTLRTNENLEPLRKDPRFQQLMKAAEALADAQSRPKK